MSWRWGTPSDHRLIDAALLGLLLGLLLVYTIAPELIWGEAGL